MQNSQPDSRIKILYIITRGEMGGAQRYVLDLAKNFAQQDFSVTVVMGREKTQLAEELKNINIRTILANHLVRDIRPVQDLLAIWELKTIISRENPQVIHLNSSKAGILGSLAAWLARNPNVIFTAHGFAFLEPLSTLRQILYFWAEKIASKFRKKIICVSNLDRESALKRRLCKPEKLITIHNGIDIANLQFLPISVARQRLNLLPRNQIIGTIAYLYPNKGIRFFIAAAARILKQYPATQFVVLGTGEQQKNLQKFIEKLQISKKFFLLNPSGFSPASYLSAFDIFVLPSLKEGFPYTILEAMAAGKPIVASSVGGIPEMLTDGTEGLLVKPGNDETLVQSLSRLIRDPGLAKKMGQQAQKKILHFTLRKMIDQTRHVYQELLTKL